MTMTLSLLVQNLGPAGSSNDIVSCGGGRSAWRRCVTWITIMWVGMWVELHLVDIDYDVVGYLRSTTDAQTT